MADETTATFDELLWEMREPLQRLFPTEFPFHAELERFADKSNFSGSEAIIPIVLSQLQGGGSLAEGGTVNKPKVYRTDRAHVEIAELAFPISMTQKLRYSSMDNAAAEVVASKVTDARTGLARIENEQMFGNGTGLLATISDSATSLTVTVGTGVNWRLFYPGRIVDILTVTTGADPGQGTSRLIASVDKSAGTITFSTTSQGGGSGNIVHTSASGIYIEGSYGTAMQGLKQAVTQTGEFEGIDRSSVVEWRATDGRNGDTDSLPLSVTMMEDGLVELGQRYQVPESEYFGVGDPKSINLYGRQYYSQMRMPVETRQLDTGFTGYAFEGITLVKDFDAPPSSVYWIHKPSVKVYVFPGGWPDFDKLTGATWQRFSRVTSVEAWLLDFRQVGYKQLGKIVYFNNLAQS